MEDTKKLSPEERVIKLRELEKVRKEEIDEAHELLKKSLGELEQERLHKVPPEINLEQAVSAAPVEVTGEEQKIRQREQHTSYIAQLSEKPIEDLSEQRQYLSSQVELGVISDSYQQGKALGSAYELMQAAEAKQEYFSGKGDVTPAGYMARINAEVDAASSLVERLKRDYER